MASNIPISTGSGAASVATEQIGNFQFQQIKVIGGETGSTSVWGINPDRSAQVSVVGTVNVAFSGSPSISGAVTVSGSVLLGSSNASVITRWADSSVIAIATGSVVAIAAGNQSVSGTVGASVIGWVPIQPSNTSTIGIFQNSSILAVPVGSVITVWQNSSVLAVPVGSTIGVWQSPSIVGTYAEDAASASGDKGLFILGVRNDTVASLASADLDYVARASDSAGRTLIRPFAAEEARVEGYASLVSSSVTTLVAAAGTGLRNYITDIMVANTGATTTLITFKDGLGSILGYTIAPTGGGSNMIGFATPMRTGANATFDFQPTSSSSILFATVKGFKAP